MTREEEAMCNVYTYIYSYMYVFVYIVYRMRVCGERERGKSAYTILRILVCIITTDIINVNNTNGLFLYAFPPPPLKKSRFDLLVQIVEKRS